MSATIHWRPESDEGKDFRGGTSTSFDKIRQTFGNVLTQADVPALRAMAIAADDKFYHEVADKIEQVGSIKIWATY